MVERANLAEKLDDEELKDIASKVFEEFEGDLESRSEWEEMHAEYRELYAQTHFPDTPPWDGASRESVPVLTEACNSFASRAYKAVFASRNFVQALPTDTASADMMGVAERVGKHMSYQLTVVDRTYKKDKNAMFLACARDGSDFTKTYRDVRFGQNFIERIRAEDLIVPYGVGPRDLVDIERITHRMYKSINYTKILAERDFFTSPCKPCSDYGDSPVQQAEDEAQGLRDYRPFGKDKPACILEQHTMLDLDDDGIAEPYIVWMDKEDKSIKRIQVGYEVDEEGNAKDENKKRVEYFTHYQFLTNPDGFYGLGYGFLLAQLNIGVNKILRQTIDAGELANIGNMSGFIDSRLGTKGGGVEMIMGQFQKIPRSVGDIRSGIYTFNFPGPNGAYVDLGRELQQICQRLGNTTDAVTGDIEKVMQPMTIMTLLESSLQMPTAVMEQMAMSFEDELAKLYRLNKMYLQKAERAVLGAEEIEITPQDYQHDMRIVPILDPRQITQQQRIAKAQSQYQFVMNDPDLSQNPQARREAQKRMLIAMQTEDVDDYLPEEPEVQQIDDQQIENAYFLLPAENRPLFDVFPDQDHATHIAMLDDFIEMLRTNITPDVESKYLAGDTTMQKMIMGFTDEIKQDVLQQALAHRRKHVGYLYKETAGSEDVRQGRTGNMGEQSPDAMGIPEAPGGVQGGLMEELLAGGFAPPTGAAGRDGVAEGEGVLNRIPLTENEV